MYLKVKNLFYKLSEDLNIELNSLSAEIQPADCCKFVILDDFDNYNLKIYQSLITIEASQVKKIVKNIISRLFESFATDIEVHFEPRDLLKIHFKIQNFIPITIEGTLKKDASKNVLIYQFDNIWFYKLSFKTLLEPISKIPGFSISYKTTDGKAELEMHLLRIFIDKFVGKLSLDLTLEDVYFTETGLVLVSSSDNVIKIEDNLFPNLPESYALFKDIDIKVNNIELSKSNVFIYKENGQSFMFSFAEYREIIDNSTILLNKDDSLTIKVND